MKSCNCLLQTRKKKIQKVNVATESSTYFDIKVSLKLYFLFLTLIIINISPEK